MIKMPGTTHHVKIQQTIIALAKVLNSLQVKWVLGSSCSLMVQGIDIVPRDIDIVITPDSLPLVKENFGKHIVNEESDWLQLNIDGVEVEFIVIDNIVFPEPRPYKGELVPVNSLEEELYWYKKRDKEDMVKLIEKHLGSEYLHPTRARNS